VEPEIGYVQGLGYMVAILLMYLDKEEAFSIMLKIFNGKKYKMKEFYTKNMPGLRCSFYVFLRLFRSQMPKLHDHLLSENFIPSFYATKWFMTIYSNNMPIELTLRIWDMFFVEGKECLYRVALAFMKINEKQLLASDFEKLSEILTKYQKKGTKIKYPNLKPKDDTQNSQAISNINKILYDNQEHSQTLEEMIEEVITMAGKVDVTPSKIEKYEKEFANQPKPEVVQYCLC